MHTNKTMSTCEHMTAGTVPVLTVPASSKQGPSTATVVYFLLISV